MYYNDENQILFIERVSYFFLKKYEKKVNILLYARMLKIVSAECAS